MASKALRLSSQPPHALDGGFTVCCLPPGHCTAAVALKTVQHLQQKQKQHRLLSMHPISCCHVQLCTLQMSLSSLFITHSTHICHLSQHLVAMRRSTLDPCPLFHCVFRGLWMPGQSLDENPSVTSEVLQDSTFAQEMYITVPAAQLFHSPGIYQLQVSTATSSQGCSCLQQLVVC